MLRSAALGVWGFVVGDDWRTALGVVLMLGGVALLEAAGLAAWWLAALAPLAILRLSVGRRR